nr:williams-beuren syndrome chromosomal region 27 protein [Quercus suber]
MAVETSTGGNTFLARVYEAKSADDCKKIYAEWAETYNAEVNGPSLEYVAPVLAAQAIGTANGRIDGSILDAGCGTGLVGIALHQAGAKDIDGIDLSPEMLKIAEKTAVYKKLTTADLCQRIDIPDAKYDVVTCCGTLTHGHVGAKPALSEFVRVTKKGGVIVATVLDDLWSSGGFKAEVDRLRVEGLVEVLSVENADYRRGDSVKARMLVLKRR